MPAILVTPAVLLILLSSPRETKGSNAPAQSSAMETIKLPKPRQSSSVSVEEALLKRRSVREFGRGALTIEEVAQLLWAAQGITEPVRGLRTSPSAGALYPLEMYVVAANVTGLAPGVYKYRPRQHDLAKVGDRDVRPELSRAALEQEFIRDAAIDLVFAAVIERTAVKYGARTTRYVNFEIGHASENVFLQAIALRLATVVVGAFYDEDVKKVVGMDTRESALYIMPIGRMPR